MTQKLCLELIRKLLLFASQQKSQIWSSSFYFEAENSLKNCLMFKGYLKHNQRGLQRNERPCRYISDKKAWILLPSKEYLHTQSLCIIYRAIIKL